MTKRITRPKQLFHLDAVRAKLRAWRYIDLLHQHIEGTRELSLSRIRAIEILLRKCIPDLTATAIRAEVTHRYVAMLPDVLSKEDWEKKYGAHTIQ